MKKKISPRELREQRNAQKQSFIDANAKQFNQAKKTAEERAEERRKAEEQAEKQASAHRLVMRSISAPKLLPARVRKLSTEQKSKAKAAGLKSTFILGEDKLLMTAFGKGNDAMIEKRINGNEIINVSEKPTFSVTWEGETSFKIDGRVKDARADNPLHVSETIVPEHDDLIHARTALEKRYFGENFSDNIHIQAIYNILDIDKILSIHINNIVFMLNNLLREDGLEFTDIVGDLLEGKSYEKFLTPSGEKDEYKLKAFLKLCSAKQLRYLNLEVLPEKKEDDEKKSEKKEKTDPATLKLTQNEFYQVLTLLSKMRQMLAHGDAGNNIYKTEDFSKPEQTALLEKLYKQRIDELNRGFLKKAKVNLVLLFRAYEVNSREQKAVFVRNYYDFVVRKQYKNTGFSIKLLREHMTEDIEEASIIRSQEYDTVRGKLNPFVDFAIYHFYREHASQGDGLVNQLRAAMSEAEKDEVYKKEAGKLWPQIRNLVLNHILPEMNGTNISQISADPEVDRDMLADILVSTKATGFSRMVYLLTLFINGKEINDLLTTLIHKFENIAAFNKVMRQERLNANYTQGFELFALSDHVAEELRVINNFARMSKPSAKVKEQMFIEAMRVLGVRSDLADENKLLQEVKYYLDPELAPKDSPERELRNFIANNVIESDRFIYLCRYCNVKKIKAFAGNRKVIRFVLNDIPEPQIERYYNSINASEESFREGMRDFLAERISTLTFEEFRGIRQNDKIANLEEQEEKRKKKALVRLYLTVLYLAVKNLVYINSRYFLAFHCVERDRLLLENEKWTNIPKDRKFDTEFVYARFAETFLEKHPQKKKRVGEYLKENFSNSDDYAIRAYRNTIDHLDAVRNADRYINEVESVTSWYDLYHYLVQRAIMDQYAWDCCHESRANPGRMIITEGELNPKTLEYFGKISQYHSCCRDFIKALNVPFAYNLPRYKNLSIDGLFDKNRPGEKGCGKIRKKKG